jgi:hypothetical protein
MRVGCIQRECPRKMTPVPAQCDLLGNVSRAGGWRPDGSSRRTRIGIVAAPGEMVELVFEGPHPFPNAQAEIPILRRPYGIHDFRMVAMPDDERIVDHRVGNGSSVQGFGRENHVPHPNDAGTVIVIVPAVIIDQRRWHKHRVSRLDIPAAVSWRHSFVQPASSPRAGRAQEREYQGTESSCQLSVMSLHSSFSSQTGIVALEVKATLRVL